MSAPTAAIDRVLGVDDLKVWFPRTSEIVRRRIGWFKAVDGVSFGVAVGETLAIVGESGSGKTTTGRAIVRVQDVTSGRISLRGEDITTLRGSELRRRRRLLQMVFQDPTGSLNPRRTIGDVLGESLKAHGSARVAVGAQIDELLGEVGLDSRYRDRLPRELSGGQRQRAGIARALSTNPVLIVCDEPVSSLDVSVQAQVLTLLADLQARRGLSYVFISHDLAVVRALAHRVAVMFKGRIVELGNADDVFEQPRHPYTAALLSAVPTGDPDSSRRRLSIQSSGDTVDGGCPFRDRCWAYQALDRPAVCAEEGPALAAAPTVTHAVACHFGAGPVPLSPDLAASTPESVRRTPGGDVSLTPRPDPRSSPA